MYDAEICYDHNGMTYQYMKCHFHILEHPCITSRSYKSGQLFFFAKSSQGPINGSLPPMTWRIDFIELCECYGYNTDT